MFAASASAFWIRRSTSRTVSRYSLTLAWSAGPSLRFRLAMSSVTQSSRLARLRSAARRSARVPPSPKSRSNTTRGCAT